VLAVILAAGRGKRLRALTAGGSKAMLPVEGRPLVAWVADLLLGAGASRLVVVASPDDDRLRARVATRFDGLVPPGVELQTAVQPEPLGMGHALGCAAPHIDGPFLLSACDNLVRPAHLAELWNRLAQGDADAVLSIRPGPPDEVERGSAVVLDGERVVRIVEKPAPGTAPSNLVSLPLYAFRPRILDYLAGLTPSPRGEMELQAAIQALIDDGGRVVTVHTDWRWTVNRPEDLGIPGL
jgi:dTDP-glucose pyrophosphorylase